ncbi:MAG: glutaredoxin family protein [Thermoleophilia bacterium]|nr:glutaredoxin family protein [Thermoleophilia bacterium]
MPAPELTVYTATGCCLCDDARSVLDRLAPELGIAVRWVYIDGDPELEARWRERIPAGVLDGRRVFKYRVDEELLRRRAARRTTG